MDEYKLPKDFFKNNPVKSYSAPQLFLTSLLLGENEDLSSELDKMTSPVDEKVMVRSEAQRRLIEETNDSAALVDLMRKNIDLLNINAFINKVLARQDECLPLLLKRYLTSGNDGFIETSTKVLIKADENYARQLQETYDRIRNPYARACACLVFGQRRMKNLLPFLVGEYESFKRNYSDEGLEQFPLAAIYLMSGKSIF